MHPLSRLLVLLALVWGTPPALFANLIGDEIKLTRHSSTPFIPGVATTVSMRTVADPAIEWVSADTRNRVDVRGSSIVFSRTAGSGVWNLKDIDWTFEDLDWLPVDGTITSVSLIPEEFDSFHLDHFFKLGIDGVDVDKFTISRKSGAAGNGDIWLLPDKSFTIVIEATHPVPEPSTFALIGLGGATVAILCRGRRRLGA